MTAGKTIPKRELLLEFHTVLYRAYDVMQLAFHRRAKLGLNQDEIARRLGEDKGRISRILRGRENLTLKTLSKMATAMDCRVIVDFVPYENLGEPLRVDEAVTTSNHHHNSFHNLPAPTNPYGEGQTTEMKLALPEFDAQAA